MVWIHTQALKHDSFSAEGSGPRDHPTTVPNVRSEELRINPV